MWTSMQDGPYGGYTHRTQQSLESRIHENVYVRFGGGPMEKYPTLDEGGAMGVEQRILAVGIDSWEGEMTYRGTTFMVEAMERVEKGETGWDLEVLRQTGRAIVQPLSNTRYLTLDAALEGARQVIRHIVDGTDQKQNG